MQTQTFPINNPEQFKTQALYWANAFDTACYFDSNQYNTDAYSAFDVVVAAGVQREISCPAAQAFDELDKFLEGNSTYIPGFLSYDLKNETEKLESNNPDQLDFPDLYFFAPQHLIIIRGNEASISSKDVKWVWETIQQTEINPVSKTNFNGRVQNRVSKKDYIDTVQQIQQNIRQGDIYEMNFCQEFYAEHFRIDPLGIFSELNRVSPTPFSSFFKHNQQYILSATPERFLSKRGQKLISQPIKGTAKRQNDLAKDEKAKKDLLYSEKERSENVMIVDLVRNDLTKSAQPGSVQVEELFGIYTFQQVHQMISTVVCQAREDLTNPQIIKNTFPMGSMTGAPKIRAMELIEKYERSKRGIYSGALGYFSPTGDFDFNVVIRTILYNDQNQYLSFHVGSAITIDSVPELEYQECLLKAEAIFSVLKR
ncbi:MAG TPA: aminodeoxychorismate synthase component I [Daejeonella sp.]|nr:aminodeoxychorismate synthase component I [Daejeonella sp.]